jgi:tetratricopeptide (TPR) repeat protein
VTVVEDCEESAVTEILADTEREKPPKLKAEPSRLPTLLTVIVAFALGAGAMWLLGESHPWPKQSIATKSAAEPRPEEPPDVSQLAPADAATTLANWNYDRHNWSHAIEHYEQAIALGRDNADVRTDLGNCFRFLGQPQRALEQYEIAQRQNPQHENSLLNQAGLFAEVLHDSGRAKAAAHEFITRFPQSPRAESARNLIGQLERETDNGKQRIRDSLNGKP